MLLLKVTPENETWIGLVNFIAGIYMLWYVYKALKVVYQRTTFRTITKFIGIYISYMVVFVFCFCLVLIISVLLL
jgi:hypothetical protein